MKYSDSTRVDRILRRCIESAEIDLSGLVVFTEAATGPYLYTPIMCVLAGAKKVFAVAADSAFALKEEIKQRTLAATSHWGVSDTINVVFQKIEDDVGECDVITNTGFVRPIDAKMISWMKPTAVVPLMWETWELRDGELDLDACRRREILVMGTDEFAPPHAMYPWSGFAAMKLLFELGLEGYKTKVLLLGGRPGLGKSIYDHFKRLDMEVSWFSDDQEESRPYHELPAHFEEYGAEYDALILAEYDKPVRLLGHGGLLTYEQILTVNPGLRLGVAAGNIDAAGLRQSGLHYFPEVIRPFKYLSYQAHHLGPLPVLELYAAGLKVGEVMARARLSGLGLAASARHSLENTWAMDFEGGRAWAKDAS